MTSVRGARTVRALVGCAGSRRGVDGTGVGPERGGPVRLGRSGGAL